MNNTQFLQILKDSFLVYLRTSARSNEKLKVLHGAISADFAQKLGDPKYTITSLGYGSGRESNIKGRYVDKAVDITILENGVPIAGIAVKYVMSNYSQNSNNYFENMLGETANIRCAQIPYFQIFVIPDLLPYFDKSGKITRWEHITEHHLKKYMKLSNDNIDLFLHTPNKTLVELIHIEPSGSDSITNSQEYKDYYLNHDFTFCLSNDTYTFGRTIIYNDYETFIEKIVYAVKSI